MLAKRVLVAAILLPIGLVLIWLGGMAFALMVALILSLAAWEYVSLFRAGGLQPSGVLVVTGTLALVIGRYFTGFSSAAWLVSLVILASMAYHLVAYERGRDQAGTDFGVTLAGVMYFGWIGSYLISLRELPEGVWWVLLALPSVWLADSGAYFIGRRFGRHKLSPRLSPKKTWEGYLGGVLFGVLGGALLAYIWSFWTGPDTYITPLNGALMGLVLSVITTLGDLGESMIKRQVGVKDSGKLLPGHGGVFDRIDSWLWAGVLAYYLVVWVFIR
ncbi:MAG: phosphatidate cytidylyltransferase [Anaerolineales bacterium]